MKANRSSLELFVVALAVAATGSAVASDGLLLSSSDSKSTRQTYLTVQSEGLSRGLAFRVHMPKGVTGMNTKNCAAAVPAGVTARCVFNEEKGILAVAVMNFSGGNLPAGEIPVGSIEYVSFDKAGPRVEQIAGATPSSGSSRAKASN